MERDWSDKLAFPAPADFQETSITLLDILKKAEARGLDLIAFTDHNSVAGYAQLLREIEQLEWLEKLKRILPDEKRRLEEYQRLRQKILVLPGFEDLTQPRQVHFEGLILRLGVAVQYSYFHLYSFAE